MGRIGIMNSYPGYGYGPYVGAVAATTPVTRKIVDAFTQNYGRPPATWLEVVDFLVAGAIEMAGEQGGLSEAQTVQRLKQGAARYGIRL